MSRKHHRSKGKTVQKMTRNGLVQENLATGEIKHISSRMAEQEFRHAGSNDDATLPAQASSASRHPSYQQDFSVRNTAVSLKNSQDNPSGSVAPAGQSGHFHYKRAAFQQTSAAADTTTSLSATPTGNAPPSIAPAALEQTSYQSAQEILFNKEEIIPETAAPTAVQQSVRQTFHQSALDALYTRDDVSNAITSGSFRQTAEQQRLVFHQNDAGGNTTIPEQAQQHRRYQQYTQQPMDFSAAAIPQSKNYEPYPVSQEQKQSIPDPVSSQHQESALGSYLFAAAEHHAGQTQTDQVTTHHGTYQKHHAYAECQTFHEQLHSIKHEPFHENDNAHTENPSTSSGHRQHARQSSVHKMAQAAPPDTEPTATDTALIASDATPPVTKVFPQDNGIDLHTRVDLKPLAKETLSQPVSAAFVEQPQGVRSHTVVNDTNSEYTKAPALQAHHERLQQTPIILKDTSVADKKTISTRKRPQIQLGKQKESPSDTSKSRGTNLAAVITPLTASETAQEIPVKIPNAPAVTHEKKPVKDNGIPIKHRVEKSEAAVSDGELNFNKRAADKIPNKKNVTQKTALKNYHQKIFQEQSEASDALPANGKATPDKQSSEKKLLTRRERLKQKAAEDSSRKTTDFKETAADSKQASASSARKAQGKKNVKSKTVESSKKKSADQSKQAARKKSRLQFSKEDESGKPGIIGKIKSGTKTATGLAVDAAGTVIHGRLHDAEQDNTAVEALHKTELLSEHGIRTTKNLRSASRLHQEKVAAKKASRLRESVAESQSALHMGELKNQQTETKKKSLLNRFFQKQQNKRRAVEAARAAKSGTKNTAKTAKSTASAVERTAAAIKDFAVSHKKAGLALVALLLLFAFLLTQLQSCSVIVSQSLGSISASSWCAEDSEIKQADLYYSKLEAELQYKVDHMESSHSGCDEYNYNIGEIGHDPVVLISYLCAKYGDFTFNREIKRELENLFSQQYHLTEEVKNETRTITKSVRVGESLGSVVTSGYCNCSICCGQWSGGPTASGAYPQANHTIAVDASNPFVPMGTKVVMNGVEYTVEDTGAFDRYGVQFDVYYDNHAAASAHGHQTWEAYIADDNGSQTVNVTTTENVNACYVTLTSTNLSVLVNSLLDSDQKERYDIYTSSRGNRCCLGSPFETNWRGNISSYFGYRTSPTTGEVKMHEGLDIAMPAGTQILSVQDGTVQTAGYSSSYGNYVVIKNDDGYQTLYAHCQTLNVSAGQTVEKGDVIATVGSTGNSTGNHLHIEFRYKGDLYNPYFYLDTGSGSAYGGGGAALTTEAQQKLFAEAEKYLGMPYVWGGSSPATGFDCSGFVSYVFTNSGVYNMGRLTAQGIYDICTPISASEAQPGDIIFFKGTYNTSEVSHVGIYAGNGKMLHCGDPIQYTSIETSYWQSHFYAFGRVGN